MLAGNFIVKKDSKAMRIVLVIGLISASGLLLLERKRVSDATLQRLADAVAIAAMLAAVAVYVVPVAAPSFHKTQIFRIL